MLFVVGCALRVSVWAYVLIIFGITQFLGNCSACDKLQHLHWLNDYKIG